MMNQQSKYCLATVTSEGYIQWTMTMLFSFLETNSWFSGDIVVIADKLTDESIQRLAIFPKIKIERPQDSMLQKLDDLCSVLPIFRSRIPGFFSLEIFRFTKYEKVLFLDSDMIVVQDIEELFDLPGHFYGCAEWFSGKVRKLSDYKSVFSDESNGDIIENAINTGFMLISGETIGDTVYQGLAEMLSTKNFEDSTTLNTDQLIINKYFRNRIALLDTRYNYRPKNSRGILARENIKLEDAKIIHFLLKSKPWNLQNVMPTSEQNIDLLKSYELWYQWYFRLLKFNHLQHKIRYLSEVEKQK